MGSKLNQAFVEPVVGPGTVWEALGTCDPSSRTLPLGSCRKAQTSATGNHDSEHKRHGNLPEFCWTIQGHNNMLLLVSTTNVQTQLKKMMMTGEGTRDIINR